MNFLEDPIVEPKPPSLLSRLLSDSGTESSKRAAALLCTCYLIISAFVQKVLLVLLMFSIIRPPEYVIPLFFDMMETNDLVVTMIALIAFVGVAAELVLPVMNWKFNAKSLFARTGTPETTDTTIINRQVDTQNVTGDVRQKEKQVDEFEFEKENIPDNPEVNIHKINHGR